MSLAVDPNTASGYNGSTNALTGSISTAANKTVVYILVCSGSQVTSISDAAGLTWARRSSINVAGTTTELWYAPAPTILSSDDISIFLQAATSVAFVQIAIQGAANYLSPFDPNASLPGLAQYGSGNSGASPPISTNFANACLVVGYGNFGDGSPSVGDPFTQQKSSQNAEISCAIATYIVSKQANNIQVAVNGGGSSALGVISDAVYAPGPVRNLFVTAGF